MTADDLISMHKACENVIQDMSLVPDDSPMYRVASAISVLATVQRDLLAGALDAALRHGPTPP